MLKSITPIWSRLRHIHRPELFLVRAHAPVDGDQPTVGQRLAERVAASVGSWWFLGGQAFFLFLWLVYVVSPENWTGPYVKEAESK